MIVDWLYYITLAFLLIRLGVALYNLISAPYLQKCKAPATAGRVSVLVPMRNEESNVKGLVKTLRAQDWQDLEILILDDDSSDNTWNELQKHAGQDIKLLKGKPLPAGWLGKNWACHQLAKAATGEYLLFMDADVRMQPGAIAAAAVELRRKGLHLLSLFPDQEMRTAGEKLVVPLMHYLLLGLLPLRLVYKSRNPAFAAANGQFMFFDAANYQENRWHERLRRQVTEDIEAVRLMKKEGYRCETLLGNRLVYCRMYHSLQEALQGFSKNLFAGFGRNPWLMGIYFFFSLLVYPLLFLFLPFYYVLPLLAGAALLKAMISYLGKQHMIEQLMLQPVQMLVFLYLAALSASRHYRRNNQWKGRNTDII